MIFSCCKLHYGTCFGARNKLLNFCRIVWIIYALYNAYKLVYSFFAVVALLSLSSLFRSKLFDICIYISLVKLEKILNFISVRHQSSTQIDSNCTLLASTQLFAINPVWLVSSLGLYIVSLNSY